MSEPERIERAAIWHRGLVHSVARPGRHHDVIRTMAEKHGLGPEAQRHQGFYTSHERFVDRKEGAKIAIAAGQIEALKWPPDLYSEDLW